MARAVQSRAGQRRGANQRLGRDEISPIAPAREPLVPAKRRIAEALAALLVAHYRRQQERANLERVPLP